ncbi:MULTISPECIES: MFS transporter [Burkholderia]|uniref:MFS transporter n=1 Tax=Burkholderia TaxID=32008 RepID=UPI00117D8DA0|nr:MULTISPECIES: MFS transporter [Burkholderia]
MFENEDPDPWIRDLLIPLFANAAIWAVTVSVVVVSRVIENPALLFGPLPSHEGQALLALADSRTVFWPVLAAVALFFIAWLLSIRPPKRRKGRKSPQYLKRQFFDELRSFALNAGSLSAAACYYGKNITLLWLVVLCWLFWVVLQWIWLQNQQHSFPNS